MMKKSTIALLFTFAVLPTTLAFAKDKNDASVPKNIIFVVVDGMGPAQEEAAEIYLNEAIRFRAFPFSGKVTTHNAQGGITDSAAAATAMATGVKVNNSVISQRIPGDHSDLKTILERAKEMGKSTGLVTNVLFTDATPACFGAHTSARTADDEVLTSYFTKTFLNVVFGSDLPKFRTSVATAEVNYLVATSNKTLAEKTADAVKLGACDAASCPHVYGGFGTYPMLPGQIESWKALPIEAASPAYFAENGIPHLSEMGSSALSILSQNKDGFFLMLESGQVDWIGHRNRSFSNDAPEKSAAYALGVEFAELNRTLDILLSFLSSHPDTLIVVTADHETGGLVVDRQATTCIGQKGCLPQLKWTSPLKDNSDEPIANHTGVNVDVYAAGKNAEAFAGTNIIPMDNTEFVTKILGAPTMTGE